MVDLLCVMWRPVGAAAVFQAREPSAAEITQHAATLAQAYNDPHNAPLMGNTETMSSADVVAHYTTMNNAGARQFHLLVDDVLVGDADLRNIDASAHTCEFAFMIAQRTTQGRGWGTRFARMIHQVAFTQLGIERIYVAIVPDNQASRRVLKNSATSLMVALPPGPVPTTPATSRCRSIASALWQRSNWSESKSARGNAPCSAHRGNAG